MLLKSSRGYLLKQIGCVTLGMWIFIIIITFIQTKDVAISRIFIGTGLIAIILFCILALCILPLDIKADEEYVYISKWFKRYKISFNEIKTVTIYSGVRGTPMMDITKMDGKTVTQSISILNDKNTLLLINIFKTHNIQQSKHK